MKKILLIIAMLTIMFVSLSAQNVVVYGSVLERDGSIIAGNPYVPLPYAHHIVLHGYDSDGNMLLGCFKPIVDGHYIFIEEEFEGVNWDEVTSIWVYLDGSNFSPKTIDPYTGNHRVCFIFNDTIK
ncbi:MAG: hypothetical protein M0Q94_15415 [Candidatus Cloacimonetes bacterium]|nr:hypothetical protein [Candidatus Cloacimonadota bacterium]